MKRQIFSPVLLIALLVCMLACKKSSVTLLTTFKFNAGGNTYQLDGGEGPSFNCIVCLSAITKFSDHYLLRVTNSQNGINSISLKINTTVLSAGTYTLTATSTIAGNADHILSLTVPNLLTSIFAASTEVGDFATVTITSIHDGSYADGVFNAKLTLSTPINSSNKIDITDGAFQNLKIQQ